MPNSLNVERLETVARGLGDRLSETAFVGGAVVELYVADQAAPPIRYTDDIDCVVPARDGRELQQWEADLRRRGFQHDTTQGAPICRWVYDETRVDVMPIHEDPLGFTNPWYEEGLRNTLPFRLPSGLEIRIFALPWFVATKMVAIRNRGGTDYRVSHDFEDIVYLWDCIPDFVQRLREAPSQLSHWIRMELTEWKGRPNLREEIECMVEANSPNRTQRILAELRAFVEGGGEAMGD